MGQPRQGLLHGGAHPFAHRVVPLPRGSQHDRQLTCVSHDSKFQMYTCDTWYWQPPWAR